MTDALPPIITLSPNAWDTPWWVDRHYLMSGLARRGWPVTYSVGPLSVWARGTPEWREAPLFSRLETLRDPANGKLVIDRPGRLTPLVPRVPLLKRLVIAHHMRRLTRSAHLAGGESPVAFICDVRFVPYLECIPAAHVVFHIHDAWWLSNGWTDADARNLEYIVERADLVLALADTMIRDLPGSGPQKGRVLDQAVSYDQYVEGASEPPPDDLADIPQPRIGYMGRISRKVDLELVLEISEARPDWHWVFVGAVGVGFRDDPSMQAALERCRKRANVHLLGPRSQTSMPAYMAHMDVNTMCYRTGGGQWEAGNPLKLYEYLAAGKPVVGAGLENVRKFHRVVDVAEGKSEWIQAIERALHAGGVATTAERREIASRNSWTSRVDELEAWLLEMIGQREQGR